MLSQQCLIRTLNKYMYCSFVSDGNFWREKKKKYTQKKEKKSSVLL